MRLHYLSRVAWRVTQDAGEGSLAAAPEVDLALKFEAVLVREGQLLAQIKRRAVEHRRIAAFGHLRNHLADNFWRIHSRAPNRLKHVVNHREHALTLADGVARRLALVLLHIIGTAVRRLRRLILLHVGALIG